MLKKHDSIFNIGILHMSNIMIQCMCKGKENVFHPIAHTLFF